MRPSPLQLDSYYIAELHFLEQEYKSADEQAAVTIADLKVEVEAHVHKTNPLERMCELTVELDDAAKKNFPYTFRIVLVGFFEISKQYPSEHVDVMFNANAPALLYSAARELLSLISGRSFSAAVLLPSVTFIQPIEKAEAGQKAAKSAKKLSAKKKTKTVRKK